jgi:quercetin dioxygenase-like cupin family protein
MRSITTTCAMAAGLAALLVCVTGAQTGESQKHKAVMMSHLYTGPDGQTHAEEVEAKFTAGSPNEVFKLMAVTGAELHRSVPGTVQDWHTAPRRQYVITLSGQAELEVAGGKKIHVGPGHIDLVEDTTGKGHITKTVGNEDRVTLTLPLSDQSNRSSTASR